MSTKKTAYKGCLFYVLIYVTGTLNLMHGSCSVESGFVGKYFQYKIVGAGGGGDGETF